MNTIKKLKEKSLQLKERNLFDQGATETEINEFETEMKIKLPQIIKDFYLTYNGGCFADDSWDKKELLNPDEWSSIIWNSNYFLRLDEIIEAYHFEGKFSSVDFQEQENDTQRRFIPIMHTNGQETIVWEATHENETPILDAFHENNANEWGILYKSFKDLLNDYIEKEGQIETVA